MTKLKFADGLDSVLDDHLDSTSYKVGNVIELFHKHYSEFAEKLGDNEIEKACFFYCLTNAITQQILD
jgi:hypothetical protein